MSGGEFECRREVELGAPIDAVWAAVATSAGNEGWLFPSPLPEGSPGVVSEPPTRFAVRVEQGAWFNDLSYELESLDDLRTHLRYEHRGIFPADFDVQNVALQEHTDFYLHTLGEYLTHYGGRAARYVGDVPRGLEAPAATAAPDGFERLIDALAIGRDAGVGDRVALEAPEPVSCVVDYRTANFLGLRSTDALYCFFGRNAFGSPVAMSIHSFDGSDGSQMRARWERWLADELS